MGPDCGTAIINGIPLAFANVVKRGPIGAVGASGTGLQEVTVLVDRLGGGISQAIGTGGHDLSNEVGGISMLTGLQYLADDPDTRVIVLISKPPVEGNRRGHPRQGARFRQTGGGDFPRRRRQGADGRQHPWRAHARGRGARGGRARPGAQARAAGRGRPHSARSPAARARPEVHPRPVQRRHLRLPGDACCCRKSPTCTAIRKVGKSLPLKDMWKSEGHTLVDLGDDVFTRGRPHPMIDYRLRTERIVQEARDPETAVLLLDVVLGFGSQRGSGRRARAGACRARAKSRTRPAARSSAWAMSAAPTAIRRDSPRRCSALRAAGMILADSNAQAARLARAIIAAGGGTRVSRLFSQGSIINVGLRSFAEAVAQAGGKADQLEWSPPAAGDRDAGLALARLVNHPLGRGGERRSPISATCSRSPCWSASAWRARNFRAWKTGCCCTPGRRSSGARCAGRCRARSSARSCTKAGRHRPTKRAQLAGSGKVKFAPCHHHGAVGPMAGVISPSMPVWIVENADGGKRAYSQPERGPGQGAALRRQRHGGHRPPEMDGRGPRAGAAGRR